MRFLDREGSNGVAGHMIVPTREGDLLAFEQTLDDGDCLGQPLNPGAPPIEAQPGLLIFRLDAASAQTELEPSVREQVDRRSFTRDQTGWRRSLFSTLVPTRRVVVASAALTNAGIGAISSVR